MKSPSFRVVLTSLGRPTLFIVYRKVHATVEASQQSIHLLGAHQISGSLHHIPPG